MVLCKPTEKIKRAFVYRNILAVKASNKNVLNNIIVIGNKNGVGNIFVLSNKI